MPYTTAEHVRLYLQADYPVQDQVVDQPVQLNELAWISFYGGAVDSSTFAVKSRRNQTLTRQQITLTATPVLLSSAPIVPGTIIVASDSSLGTIYIENQDYSINQTARKLSIIPGGRLTAGQTVTVWLETYHLYESGVDYQLDSAHGQLRRLAGGNITSGETVYLDYTPVYHTFTDDALDNAITEANGLIEREVDPNAQFGADPTLIAAATCRALEILCRTAATRELSSLRGEDKVALAWMKLADDYSARADRLLQSFRPPVVGPSMPAIS